MVGRRLAVSVAIAIAALLAGVALVAFVLRGESAETETAREATVRPTIRATLRPPVHRFGERVTAVIELTVREAEIAPQTARPGADFEPYVPLGRARRELRDFGALSQLKYTVTIQCLKRACLPEGQTGEFDFRSPGVGFRTPPPPGRRFADRRRDQRGAGGSWAPLKVTSWLSAEDVQAARWRSSLADLPAPTFRVAPRWLVGLLLGAAVALVLVAAALVNRYVRESLERRAHDLGDEAPVPPLEQALVLVEESRAGGDADGSRVALETLAHELRAGGESGLAADAERLAWSPGEPGDAELTTLVRSVRGSLDGGAP